MVSWARQFASGLCLFSAGAAVSVTSGRGSALGQFGTLGCCCELQECHISWALLCWERVPQKPLSEVPPIGCPCSGHTALWLSC